MNKKDLYKKQRVIEKAFIKQKMEIYRILERENLLEPKDINKFFSYKNLSKKYPFFCELFKDNKCCHDIKLDRMKCFNCYCPFYDREFVDEKSKLLGRCQKKSKKGKYTKGVWDCSDCKLVH